MEDVAEVAACMVADAPVMVRGWASVTCLLPVEPDFKSFPVHA